MGKPLIQTIISLVLSLLLTPLDLPVYGAEQSPTIIGAIPLPDGYARVPVDLNSFAAYLRNLPLKADNNQVYLYSGALKSNQAAHYRVVDMDVGNRDLQQCADAVIRLRAEYLFTRKAYDQIAFNFTSGDRAAFQQWAEGYRPDVHGNQVRWRKHAQSDFSYRNFRAYLTTTAFRK